MTHGPLAPPTCASRRAVTDYDSGGEAAFAVRSAMRRCAAHPHAAIVAAAVATPRTAHAPRAMVDRLTSTPTRRL